MVCEITAHHLPQPSPLLRDGIVLPFVQLLFDRLQPLPHSVATRVPLQLKGTVSCRATDVVEAQKRERLRRPQPSLCTSFGGESSEGKNSRLFRMQRQRKLGKAFPKLCEKHSGVRIVLKTGDNIVGISHEYDITLGLSVSPLISP